MKEGGKSVASVRNVCYCTSFHLKTDAKEVRLRAERCQRVYDLCPWFSRCVEFSIGALRTFLVYIFLRANVRDDYFVERKRVT